MKITAAFLSSLLICSVLMAEPVIKLIPLQSQLPQNIIPVIKPLLAATESVTGMNNQLILRVEESRLAEIRQIIDQLDRPPQRLRIEVRQGGIDDTDQSDVGVSGRISTSGDNRLNTRIRQYSTRGQHDASQMIVATEGHPARISYGQVVPYRHNDIQVNGNRITRQQYTTFVDATSGVYVIPRLNGSRVSLEIQQQRNRFRDSNGTIAVQDTSTFVSGQLGEWISLGSIGDSVYQTRQGIVSRSTRNQSTDQQIRVRVTLME